MDFLELETMEGLRWSWSSWPTAKSDCESLVVPLSIVCTLLMQSSELPVIQYDPLTYSLRGAMLNPYARLDCQSRIWSCPFCLHKNHFPRSYAGITETSLPAELFPIYSAVEYAPPRKPASTPRASAESWALDVYGGGGAAGGENGAAARGGEIEIGLA